jgi:hypothetical protein
LEAFERKDGTVVKNALINLVQSAPFRDVTGPGANNRTKMDKRISLVADCIRDA